MPWPYLPDDFREKYRSVWVDIPGALYDPVRGHQVYNTYLDQLEFAEKEFPQADIDRWSIDSNAPVGPLRHLCPTVRLSESRPYWAHHPRRCLTRRPHRALTTQRHRPAPYTRCRCRAKVKAFTFKALGGQDLRHAVGLARRRSRQTAI